MISCSVCPFIRWEWCKYDKIHKYYYCSHVLVSYPEPGRMIGIYPFVPDWCPLKNNILQSEAKQKIIDIVIKKVIKEANKENICIKKLNTSEFECLEEKYNKTIIQILVDTDADTALDFWDNLCDIDIIRDAFIDSNISVEIFWKGMEVLID